MVLILYYNLLSQPCRAVYIFLKAAGVDFQPKVIALEKGEQYKPEFTKKNPYSKVPTIEHDGFVLTESVAIMRYVTVRFNLPEHWYPRSNISKQARVDEFCNWQHWAIRKPCVEIFLNLLRDKMAVGPFTKQPMDVAKVKQAKEDLKKSLTHVANYFLKDQAFIAGDKISIGDIVAVMELLQISICLEEEQYESNKVVKAWLNRVKHALSKDYDETMVNATHVTNLYKDVVTKSQVEA